MSESSNILIVDDNKNNLLSLHALIKKYFDNVHVFEANSGLTALSLLMREKVDLVILDIQMPQMDGFETAKIIQSRPKTRHLPIVFLTAAYKSEEFQNKGYALGAADYLTKPIEPAELRNKLRLYLRFLQQEPQPILKEKELKVEQPVAELPKNSPNIEQIEKLLMELNLSLEMMIDCSEKLEKEAINSNLDDCVPDINKINSDGKQLRNMINNVLVPKIKQKQ